MGKRPTYTWQVVRGETIRTTLRLTQPNGQPVDLTGSTLSVQPPSGAVSAAIANPTQGTIQVEVRGMAVGRHPYEITITWPDLSRWVILMGYVLVEEGTYAEP